MEQGGARLEQDGERWSKMEKLGAIRSKVEQDGARHSTVGKGEARWRKVEQGGGRLEEG